MIVEFLVNGAQGSAVGERARRIASCFAADEAHVTYRDGRRAQTVVRMAAGIRRYRPKVVYAMDTAVAPTLAAVTASGRPLIVDTGDAPRAFLELIGAPAYKRQAARILEWLAYSRAHTIIVRGGRQVYQLPGKDVVVVPDGVDTKVFRPVEDVELRRGLGLDGFTTIGIQGYFTWYPKLGGGLGWELVELIARRKDLPLRAVLIGDGPGLTDLQKHAAELGVLDRLHLVGRVAYEDLPRYLGLCDVCLLTQTNDPSSQVRTTGKLPGYLAAGRYVLASRVGTAADLLDDDMLVDYNGHWDVAYPDRLGERIEQLIADPERRKVRAAQMTNVARQFEYDKVAQSCANVIRRVAE